MRIAVVFGTRPELIKLAPIILEAKNRSAFIHVISTGQHREMVSPLLDWFEVSVDFDLAVMKPKQTLSELSENVLAGFDRILQKEKYDYVFVQGDTTTAFIVALTAFYHKTNIVHVEAGLRTNNKYSPWPEEINRKLISVVADYHFAPTTQSALNLSNENIHSNVWVSGNTVIDALHYTVEKVGNQNIFPLELSEYFTGNKKHIPIVLITGHRRENWGSGLKNICEAISKLADRNKNITFVYPVHLNPNVREDVFQYLSEISNILLLPPLNYPHFVALMNRSYLILTDSGGIQEEGPGLGKPVLVMRDTTERPEGVESGNVKLVGTNADTIIEKTQLLLDSLLEYNAMAEIRNPFGDGKASRFILDVLMNHAN